MSRPPKRSSVWVTPALPERKPSMSVRRARCRARLFLRVGFAAAAMAITPALSVAPAGASPDVSAGYSCSTPIGTESANVTVVGTASVANGIIGLKNVKFTITDNLGFSLTIDNVKVHVPDPNKVSAPYRAHSAKVGSAPAGWTAGHDTHGLFALHSASITVANGMTVSNAALSGKYTDKGPAGTVIAFKPGLVSFKVTSPITISGSATCTPTTPVPKIASVTE